MSNASFELNEHLFLSIKLVSNSLIFSVFRIRTKTTSNTRFYIINSFIFSICFVIWLHIQKYVVAKKLYKILTWHSLVFPYLCFILRHHITKTACRVGLKLVCSTSVSSIYIKVCVSINEVTILEKVTLHLLVLSRYIRVSYSLDS